MRREMLLNSCQPNLICIDESRDCKYLYLTLKKGHYVLVQLV